MNGAEKMKIFALIMVNIFLRIFYRVEVVNRHKVPSKGPALLCANHNNMLDMLMLGFRCKRWIYWMAKEELFKNPIIALLYRSLGAFPVKRGAGDVASIKKAYKLLEKGKVVGIFPQGTRIDPSKINTVKPKAGAAMIAVKTGVPIIPAIVQGSYKLFSKMNVIYGDPFILENEKDKKHTKEEFTELSREILKSIYLLAEVKQ